MRWPDNILTKSLSRPWPHISMLTYLYYCWVDDTRNSCPKAVVISIVKGVFKFRKLFSKRLYSYVKTELQTHTSSTFLKQKNTKFSYSFSLSLVITVVIQLNDWVQFVQHVRGRVFWRSLIWFKIYDHSWTLLELSFALKTTKWIWRMKKKKWRPYKTQSRKLRYNVPHSLTKYVPLIPWKFHVEFNDDPAKK